MIFFVRKHGKIKDSINEYTINKYIINKYTIYIKRDIVESRKKKRKSTYIV